ncbi:MAG: M20/M25/M40 family metallo-hydrolase, partial [Saezia sp.]
ALLSVTQVHAGSTDNIIPNEAMLAGTVRTFDMETLPTLEANMRRIVETLPKMHGGSAELNFVRGYPVLVNWDQPYEFAIDGAEKLLGEGHVVKNTKRRTGSEDFAYFLQKVPGALFHLGIAPADKKVAELHNPYYDFNDDALHIGAALWAELVNAFFARA